MITKNNHPELIEKLAEGISNLTTSDDWERYLSFQRRFHRYSFGNMLLIAAQCHEATQVAGFNAWRKMNPYCPKTQTSPHAASSYSWISPPSRSRRRIRGGRCR